MAQKDKVKELVGRGLGSYHTKALQQIDRIERKNKEQNHKISILTNELDNDYLTKTEEGSVISLEHSKKGMVYLDELQGNTLVNYCTDGSKELTLNGDIDVEGTFITTTEGVDNGKVDVVCEGNTLVNLWTEDCIKTYCTFSDNTVVFTLPETEAYPFCKSKLRYNLKSGATYTVIFSVISIPSGIDIKVGGTSPNELPYFHMNITQTGLYKKALTIPSDKTDNTILPIWSYTNGSIEGDIVITKPILLEGDWTDKEIPSYFEGMKSVGQDDENGHKIEILSNNNGSLSNISTHNFNTDGNLVEHRLLEPIKTGESFKVCYTNNSSKKTDLGLKLHYPSGTRFVTFGGAGSHSRIFTNNYGETLTRISTYRDNNYDGLVIENFSITKVKNIEDTSFVDYKPYQSNKKEILINEPLRGLPIGVKDRFVKIGGKWFVERNIRQKLLTGADSEKWLIHSDSNENVIEFRCNTDSPSITNNSSSTISDKFIGKSGGDIDRIAWAGNTVYITISRNKLATVDVAGFRQWLSNNNVLVQNQLATPTYEPLELEPILNTYNDVTHLSNNSIIPCNMQIKNTGYNAIIKPSTLYTVAVDTDKNGTIGINLGSSKVTTTNNVATVTTPATLTDDSLRLYGKDIKGSKVRLLEGDKTNWIPSHFEGMKSSFEDKIQDDGSYKMEILSNNKNLFDIDAEYYKAGWGNQNYQRNGNGFSFDAMNGWNSIGYEVKGHRDKTVVVSATVTCVNKDTNKLREQSLRVHTETWGGVSGTSFLDGETKRIKFNVKLNHEGRVYFNGSSTPEGSNNGGVKWTVKDILIEDVDGGTGYFPRECNKIQFSSIEPLRGVGDVKDRFVFKDGKLMIERNCHEFIFNGSEYWGDSYQNFEKYYVMRLNPAMQFVSAWNNTENMKSSYLPSVGTYMYSESDIEKCHRGISSDNNNTIMIGVPKYIFSNANDGKQYLANNPMNVVVQRKEPTYEEIPFELQKIILEGYEDGTLFLDTNIPPTSTVTYAGETPIVKATKLNKTEVLNNTNDINDNIVPYLMDMDYRVVCLQLEGGTENVSMARLFGGTYEMLQRDILSNRYSKEEYKYRLDAYLSANKITENEYEKLGDMLND